MLYNKEVKTYIIVAVIVLLAGGLLGYTYNRMEALIHGPQIAIISPPNGTAVEDSFVHIQGTARNISEVTLNDRPIFTDEQGAISEYLLVNYGYNKITLAAQDRFGREAEKTLELIYK